MASNFKITSHRSENHLHLKLAGDFDGSSAWELLNLLRENFTGFHRIIIHTDCLNKVYPFGVHTFHQNLSSFRRNRIRLLFAGEKAGQISPEKDLCLYRVLPGDKESRMQQGKKKRTHMLKGCAV